MSKVSEIIAKLQKLQEEHGDVELYAYTQDGAYYNVCEEDIVFDGKTINIE